MSHTDVFSKRKIDVSALELGMYVCEIDRPWQDTPFLFQGFPLLTPDDLLAVRKICSFVYVDDKRRVRISLVHENYQVPDSGPPRANLKALSQEVDNARKVHNQGSGLIKTMFHDISFGHGVDTAACRQFVRNCVDSVLNNESALVWLTRIKSRDDYTGQHCLSVAILAIGFARFLGHNDDELQIIGLSGLLHDVGKIKVDQAVLNKPGKLNDDELAQMRSHAQVGYELLLGHKDLPPAVVDVAHGHHERLDGSGYPRALDAEQIPYRARLVSICDTYDAITSHRCYDDARSCKAAFKILMEGRETQFDTKLVLRFIEWMGVFPVGSIVQMHSGEVGIILESERAHRLRPRIVLMLDEGQQKRPPRYIDMSKICVDSFGNTYRIRDCLGDGAFGIHLADPEVQQLLNSTALLHLENALSA